VYPIVRGAAGAGGKFVTPGTNNKYNFSVMNHLAWWAL
jgi:hypothetical protein